MINLSSSSSRKAIEEMVSVEVQVLQRVETVFGSHPHVVALHDVYTEEKWIYIVLEYLTGGELFDQVVARGSFSERVRIVTKRM